MKVLRKSVSVTVLMLLLLPVSSICQAGAKSRAKNSVPNDELPPTITEPYRLQVGDQLDISFFKTEDLRQARIVGPDGLMHLALIGRVEAAGRTIEELTEELTERYRVEVLDPQITVSVITYSGMQIYVGGEVGAPGVLPYRGGMTTVQAIVNAGGFLRSARLSNVVLIRRGPDDRPVASLVNLARVLYKGHFEEDLALAPTDVIWVPRTKIANVNKWVEQYIRNNIPIPIGFGFNIDLNQ